MQSLTLGYPAFTPFTVIASPPCAKPHLTPIGTEYSRPARNRYSVSQNFYLELVSRLPNPGNRFITMPDGTSFSYDDVATWSGRMVNALVEL